MSEEKQPEFTLYQRFQRLGSLMCMAFDANHPAMVDFAAIGFFVKEINEGSTAYGAALLAEREKYELLECTTKRICRDLAHAVDEIPKNSHLRPILAERVTAYKERLGNTSNYRHQLHAAIWHNEFRANNLQQTVNDERKKRTVYAHLPCDKHRAEIVDCPESNVGPIIIDSICLACVREQTKNENKDC